MNITKMQATGNDFILVNNFIEKLPLASFSLLAQKLCKRKESIGADGIIFIGPAESQGSLFRMDFYNCDGSLGEMCGNGARCAARFAYEEGFSAANATFDTAKPAL